MKKLPIVVVSKIIERHFPNLKCNSVEFFPTQELINGEWVQRQSYIIDIESTTIGEEITNVVKNQLCEFLERNLSIAVVLSDDDSIPPWV